jgi:hypothetical protein
MVNVEVYTTQEEERMIKEKGNKWMDKVKYKKIISAWKPTQWTRSEKFVVKQHFFILATEINNS